MIRTSGFIPPYALSSIQASRPGHDSSRHHGCVFSSESGFRDFVFGQCHLTDSNTHAMHVAGVVGPKPPLLTRAPPRVRLPPYRGSCIKTCCRHVTPLAVLCIDPSKCWLKGFRPFPCAEIPSASGTATQSISPCIPLSRSRLHMTYPIATSFPAAFTHLSSQRPCLGLRRQGQPGLTAIADSYEPSCGAQTQWTLSPAFQPGLVH